MSAQTFNILVGIDYSDFGDLALKEAVSMAQLRAPSHIHVVHAIHYVPPAARDLIGLPITASAGAMPTEVSDRLGVYVERRLTESPGTIPDDDSSVVAQLTTHVLHGNPAEAIAQLASDIEADLVIVGTHGHRGFARLLLGSVAEGVVRLAPCPVLVVRAKGADASEEVPRIEPPCPRCVETRRATNGKEFWCAQHSEQQERRHTYHFSALRKGHQSGLLFPMR